MGRIDTLLSTLGIKPYGNEGLEISEDDLEDSLYWHKLEKLIDRKIEERIKKLEGK